MKNKIKYVVKKGKGYMPSKEMKKIANISDKNIYKKAEKKAKDSSDYERLAESIRENLGDKKWAKLVDKKAS